MQRKHPRGFGLLELALVILVISGLVGVTLLGYVRVTNNHAVNTAYQETANLVESFRQYASDLGVSTAVIHTYITSLAYPKTLDGSYVDGAAHFIRNGLAWQLRVVDTNNFAVDLSNFPTPQTCAVSAQRLLRNSRAMSEWGIKSFAIDGGANATDPKILTDLSKCDSLTLTLTKNI